MCPFSCKYQFHWCQYWIDIGKHLPNLVQSGDLCQSQFFFVFWCFVLFFFLFFWSYITGVDLSVNAFSNVLVGDIVSSGSFLDTEAFEEVEEKSAFDCVMRCVKTSGCRTIDYKRRGNRDNCFLNSNSRREVGLITNDDYIHYDVVYHTQNSEEADFGPVDNVMVS